MGDVRRRSLLFAKVRLSWTFASPTFAVICRNSPMFATVSYHGVTTTECDLAGWSAHDLDRASHTGRLGQPPVTRQQHGVDAPRRARRTTRRRP